MKIPAQGLVTTAALLVTAACGPDTPSGSTGEWPGTIESRGGVTFVENPDIGLWDTVSEPFTFELEQVFGADSAPQDAILGRIAGLVVDGDGNVHVYDSQAAQLISFAPDGSVRGRFGGAGEGPGQFNNVRGIAFDGDDTIFIGNQTGLRIDSWGTDGAYRATHLLEDSDVSRAWMGGYLAPARLAVLTTVMETAANDYVVLDVADAMSVVTRFRISAVPELELPGGFIFQLSHTFHDSRIYVGGWEQYLLRVYSAAGALERQVKRPVTYLRRPGFAAVGDSTRGTSYGGLSAPIVLPGGYWIAFASWPLNVDDPNAFTALETADRPEIEWMSSLDFFDPEGRFLGSVYTEGAPVPDIGRPWTVGPSGALYTVHVDPFPQVRRFRVLLNAPNTP